MATKGEDWTEQDLTKITRVTCYSVRMMLSNGMGNSKPALSFTIPVVVLQIALIIVFGRALVFVLKPLKQPRVISEILVGFLLGPSVLGRYTNLRLVIFPFWSVAVLETVANLGLVYFLFLVGLEMDISIIRGTSKKALVIALGGMLLPFVIGMFVTTSSRVTVNHVTYLLFVGVSLSVTAFPVLARILAEVKLLNTDLGRMAISSAVINDLVSWGLLALAIAMSESLGNAFVAVWVMLSGATFVFFCIYIVRPLIVWMTKRTPEGEPVDEICFSLILSGVLLCAFVGDAIGTHAIFGAFVYGLIIPNGPLGAMLIERLDDFASGILVPLFFAISGLRADVAVLTDFRECIATVLTVVVACLGKIFGTVITSCYFGMSIREGISLGMLMNTKGLMEMIVLNLGREQQVISDAIFVLLIITSLLVTMSITPIVTTIYKPSRRFMPYKRRSIQRTGGDQELRVLVGMHSPRALPTIINLLEASHPTKCSPLSVCALLLVELTGRASAMMISHTSQGQQPLNHTQAYSHQISSAFENFQRQWVGVSSTTLTAISPYSSMHEDICDMAEDKRVAMIILPFHKEVTIDGEMQQTNPMFRSINSSVLANAPCSVGIIIDRGLSAANRNSKNKVTQNVGILFFGGPDDREALAYAGRMAGHPAICLTVVRFLYDCSMTSMHLKGNVTMVSMTTDEERERHLDDDYLSGFRLRNAGNESVAYVEKVVKNSEETVARIRGLDTLYDLFIVGRGQGHPSALTSGMTDWTECPELGPIGDLLASSDFTSTTSVLVVQQYAGTMPGEGVDTPDIPDSPIGHYYD